MLNNSRPAWWHRDGCVAWYHAFMCVSCADIELHTGGLCETKSSRACYDVQTYKMATQAQ
jgi:hypothetical protein